MVEIDEALDILADAASPLPTETVDLREALHRVAAEAVASPVSLPPFSQSAMDGYALRAADTDEASGADPAHLQVVAEVPAGASDRLPEVESGEAVRVFTGARIPPGADSVVRRERVEHSDGAIAVESPVRKGANVRPVGEELEEGEALVDPGERLDERHRAALAMTGHSRVRVRRAPRIALLVSGDEIVPPSADRGPGEIYDANTPLLRGFFDRLGYDDVSIEHLADDRTDVETALDRALDRCDLVVSTGGVSVGDYDFLHRAVEDLGARRHFWEVDQKPGRPVFFGERDGTPFLGLPGNPGAVFVNTHVYLTRLLDGLEGRSQLRPFFRTGRLSGPIEPSSKRPRWSPCRLVGSDETAEALEPIRRGRAHRLGELFRADALVRVEAGDELVASGSRVEWVETCDRPPHPRPAGTAGAEETE